MGKPVLLLALAASLVAIPASAQTSMETQIENGHAVAVKECSGCHAVEAAGKSPRYGAPEFRHILARYHSNTLRVELVEGIKIGHRNMPRFSFDPAAVDDLIVYLQSIQVPEHPAPPGQ